MHVIVTDDRGNRYEGDIPLVKKSLNGTKNKRIIVQNKKYHGLTGDIYELIAESFFDTPKDLKQIQEHLKSKAVFHPRTNFPKPLLQLIKKKQLRRIKENNKWKYVRNG